MLVTPGKRWRHVILSTHSSWLPGDVRGFRNRDHRIHSTGDYRHPPPAVEHKELRRHHQSHSDDITRLALPWFEVVGMAIVDNLASRDHKLAILAVNPTHVHALIELPDLVDELKQVMGWCKYFATKALREIDSTVAVKIWAKGETYKPVDTAGHFYGVFAYILQEQGSDAWIWRSPVY